MSNLVRIIPSQKFFHAKRQWRVEAGPYTLLRLTYGKTGGALKTATVGDDWGRRVYPDRARLILAMEESMNALYSAPVQLWLDEDRHGRQFLEITETGRLEDFFETAEEVAGEMLSILSRAPRFTVPLGRLNCANGTLIAA